MSDDTPVADMSFEEAMREFQDVVDRLDTGDVPLEQMITLYERGAVLKKHCEDKLKSAEEKIARITQGPDGAPTGTEPLDS